MRQASAPRKAQVNAVLGGVADLSQYRRYTRKLFSRDRISLGRNNLHGTLTTNGGLYRITWRENPKKAIYVGKAKSIRQRIYNNLMKGQIRSHTLKRKLIRTNFCLEGDEKIYLSNRCMVQYIELDDPRERTFLEHYIIAAERPRFND